MILRLAAYCIFNSPGSFFDLCICVCVNSASEPWASPTSRIRFIQSEEEPGHQHFLKLPTWFLCIAKIESHRARTVLSKLNIKIKSHLPQLLVTLKLTASQDWAHLLAKNIWCPIHTTGGSPHCVQTALPVLFVELTKRVKERSFPSKAWGRGKNAHINTRKYCTIGVLQTRKWTLWKGKWLPDGFMAEPGLLCLSSTWLIFTWVLLALSALLALVGWVGLAWSQRFTSGISHLWGLRLTLGQALD